MFKRKVYESLIEWKNDNRIKVKVYKKRSESTSYNDYIKIVGV